MNGFYISMIFLGILLVIISLLFVLLDKKKGFNFIKSFDEKKRELTEIINDAEQMIEELNRFSDYVVNQMDLKNEELNKNLKAAEDKVHMISERISSFKNGAEFIQQETVEKQNNLLQPAARTIPIAESSETEISDIKITGIYNQADFAVNGGTLSTAETAVAAYTKVDAHLLTSNRRREKIVPFNNKYSEVLRLSKEGMQNLEIARNLNMGKGEVELIIGLRK